MHPSDERRRGLDPDRVLAGWERPVYLVHEHFSRSHHFDLRLEIDGVLRSWAVPKGPSTEPGVRRLAMQVPDHALSYAPFEGEIPEGSYGAGKVEIWDRGTFRILEQTPDKLVVDIRGERVQGVHHLVRTRFKDDARDDGRKWLLAKTSQVPTSAAPPSKAPPSKGSPSKALPSKARAPRAPRLSVRRQEPPSA